LFIRNHLNIADDKEEDFDENIRFYVLYLLLDQNAVYEILKISPREIKHYINDIFQSFLRESSFPISYFIRFEEFHININIMSIVISDLKYDQFEYHKTYLYQKR
jgi:hypothetical protein